MNYFKILFWVVIFLMYGHYSFALSEQESITTIQHDYYHSIGDDSLTQSDIIKKFGQPDKIKQRLAGWEIYIYDSLKYEGVRLYKEDMKLMYFPFKNEEYVPPNQYERLKRDSSLRMIFIPIITLSYLPGSLFIVLTLTLIGVLGVLFLKKWQKFFGVYILLGSILVLFGVIF